MKDMLGAIVRKLIEFPLEKLGVIYDFLEKYKKFFEDGEWGDEFKKFLRKEKCWISDLLEFISTVTVSATTTNLLVRDCIANLRKKRKVYTGSNFENWFFDKKMKPISKSELRYHKLRKSSVDNPIITELGGKDKAETTADEMLALIEMQANGESGALLNNGYANSFYIRDIKGVLRAVGCSWRGDGWYLGAGVVDYPSEWYAGRRVFSRNSSEN